MARRARQVCRARSDILRPRRRHLQKVSPRRRAGAGLRQAWLRWGLKGSAVPDAGGQAAVNDGGGGADRPSARPFDIHVADADPACRRDAVVRSFWLSLVTDPAFGCGRIRARRLLLRSVPVRMVLCEDRSAPTALYLP